MQENRVAVVTGAARGIGRRVALALSERGYAVAANDLAAPEDALEELKQVGAEARRRDHFRRLAACDRSELSWAFPPSGA
ncbi:MAG: SDR family NAD(P)-dependent oxidoreductase [Actinomycetota bacterium]|nr:SDR family NAD(P)-dependent oxidoreductase [Actinomycetota bacterium]